MMEPRKALHAPGTEGVKVNVRFRGAGVPAVRDPGRKPEGPADKPRLNIQPEPGAKHASPLKQVAARISKAKPAAPAEKTHDAPAKPSAPTMRFDPAALLAGARHVIEWGSPSNPFLKRKSGPIRPASARVVQLGLSILGAVLLGTAMGFSVLNLFFSEDPSARSNRTIDSHLPSPASPGNPMAEGESPAAAETEEELPALSAVMLQAGHFKEKEGARKTVQQLRTRGLAAVMSEDAPYRIFLGLSPTRDEALKLSSIFQKQQVDVYLKETRLGGKIRAEGGTAGKLLDILERGNRLFSRLGAASVREIREDGAAPSTAGFSADWMEEHRQFVTEYQGLASSLPDAAREPMAEMVRALDQAVQSGDEVRRHPSQALLWQMQEGLVRYVLAYERLHQALGIR